MKLVLSLLCATLLVSTAEAYTITHMGPNAPASVKRKQSCDSLGSICRGMGATACPQYIANCKATGTWSSPSLTVTGVPKGK